MKKNFLIFKILFLLVLFAPSLFSKDMVYIYHKPEFKNDVRYDYHWEVLKAALEKTKDKYGSYILKPNEKFMNEKRQIEAFKKGKGLTVIIKPANKDFEKMFIPVRIPLDKGLLGYRVFLINKKNQEKFSKIQTLDELRKLSVGQGLGWFDVKVWKANGFKVVERNNYERLFDMTIAERFDFFSRGIVEVIPEYEQRKSKMPDLQIEKTISVYYPWPFYFYFQKNENGKHLAKRVEEGLLALFEDKEVFNPIFFKYHGKALKRHNLKNRKIFYLKNPLLSSETPLENKKLWFNPYEEI